MRRLRVSMGVALLLVAAGLVTNGHAQKQWDFSDITKIKFEGISGDINFSGILDYPVSNISRLDRAC